MLVATASCDGNENMRDILTSLPDEVVHHILSFLVADLQELTVFSCVSKRCRQLFLSNPRLILYDDLLSESNCIIRLKFMNYVDRLLARRGDNKLQFFQICCELEEFRLITWIHSVLDRCKVEMLFLSIIPADEAHDKLLAFPTFIFHCESLRSLTMNYICKIRAPSLAFSSNLRYLELACITIVDARFFKWISCCCKCIEELILDHVHVPKSITIQSSSLISFRFESTYVEEITDVYISGDKLNEIVIVWSFDSPANRSLYMVTPNLKKFDVDGNVIRHFNVGKFLCLEEAVVQLCPRVDDWNNICAVLWSLHEARSVILTEEVLKTSGFNIEYWKLQDLAFFNQLKEFTIELSEASNGIELARYILEHALNLAKMVVVHKPQHSDVEREISKSKMISNATLVFMRVPQVYVHLAMLHTI